MSVPLYFDHDVDPSVAEGLRPRNVDVITAEEHGRARTPDELLLARTTHLGRLLFTHDTDFLAIVPRWRSAGREFCGIAYTHQRRLTVSHMIDDLELIAQVYDVEAVVNQVIYLPL